MFRRPVFVLLLLALAGAVCAAPDTDQLKQEMTAAVDAVRPALIRILVVSADYMQGREIKIESAGSGVIISPEGYAVTNHHVAGNARKLLCTLADRRLVDAKLIGTDPLSDIAVIKLIPPDSKPFPYASFGDSSKLQVGDRVFAMGCPFALSQSVTNGIVSNTEMVLPPMFPARAMELEGEDVGSIVRWIGHDALIRPGNSGGPLVDRQGKIVGINEISIGLSGAIPSNLAKSVVDSLIKSGKVTRSWLGIEVQPLLRSSELTKGILVSAVLADSPAAKAGLKPGDVLFSLNGTEVLARFKEQVPLFNQFAAQLPIGKPVKAEVLRDGKETALTITPSERQKAADRQYEFKTWGICATNITFQVQDQMRLATRDGVMVTGVLPSGPSATAKRPL
jgi:serine protease Do